METINLNMALPKWNVEDLCGYKPMTTFWQDFSIADKFGIKAVADTYRRCSDEWKDNYKYWTELVMVLNHKIWAHYKTNVKLARLYNDLWYDAQRYVQMWNEDEQAYYYEVTD